MACGGCRAWHRPAEGRVSVRGVSLPVWPAERRRRGHAVHLRELAAVDPAAGGAAVYRGAAGGGAALRLGAAEAGGEGRGAAGSPAARPRVGVCQPGTILTAAAIRGCAPLK